MGAQQNVHVEEISYRITLALIFGIAFLVTAQLSSIDNNSPNGKSLILQPIGIFSNMIRVAHIFYLVDII